MDTNLQIQGIKVQLDNMKLQIENIEMQNSNVMNIPMIMNPMNQIGEQLLNLSLQMLNVGIQIFNSGINLSINTNKFFDQLHKISEQINNLINNHNLKEMQKQMMQQQMIQQQILHQQLMEQQQMIEKQQMLKNQIKRIKVNAVFKGNLPRDICLVVEPDITVKELCDKFKEKIDRDFQIYYKDFFLINNAIRIDKKSQKKIKDYFKHDFDANYTIVITVTFV